MAAVTMTGFKRGTGESKLRLEGPDPVGEVRGSFPEDLKAEQD